MYDIAAPHDFNRSGHSNRHLLDCPSNARAALHHDGSLSLIPHKFAGIGGMVRGSAPPLPGQRGGRIVAFRVRRF